MPFMREGLCAADQRKCARLLDQGMKPEAVAAKMRTTVEYVKKFTTEAIEAQTKKAKAIEEEILKHQKETQATASVLASAAKGILNQRPPGEGGIFE